MSLVTWERHGDAVTLGLDRPEKKNAVNEQLLEELRVLCEQVEKDRGIRVVLLRGEGGCFCAGADLARLGASDEASLRRFHDLREEVFSRIETFPCPTLAVIEGYALGTGLELALCADFRVASQRAFLGVPSSRLGIVESYHYLARLVRSVGLARANYLVLTGERVAAEEAHRVGLVEVVAAQEDLDERVAMLVGTLAGNAAASMGRSKQVLRECAADPWLRSVVDPALPMVESIGRSEMHEGTRAFLEKRKAEFTP